MAKASFEELLADYEDYLRQHQLEVYAKTDPRVIKFRQDGYTLSNLGNLSDLGNLKIRPELPKNTEEAANYLLTLLHQESYLLERQIKALIEKFATTGGLTEELYRARTSQLKKDQTK